MSEEFPDHLKNKVNEHEERITRNERWRLQAQGGLKVIIGVLGAGAGAWVLDVVLNII